MTASVDVVSLCATTADVARKMKDLDVGAIPVCDGDNLLGMVTDRDLVLRVMANGGNPVEVTVGEAMTPGLYFCYDDEEVETAAALMSEKQIRRLPILSRTQRLVGIVSLGDMAVDALTTETSGAVLHNVSDPTQSQR
jgi:CBS domain-containing protein